MKQRQLNDCVNRGNSPEFSSEYEHQAAMRQRHLGKLKACSRAQQELEIRCCNEGSNAAWNSWPVFPPNPYKPGSIEHQEWARGARASFGWRRDHYDFGIPVAKGGEA